MTTQISVDTGGTHTDLVLFDRDRELFATLKVPTTPQDLSIGILDGVSKLCAQQNIDLSEVERFVYGTTLVTNLIVEQKSGAVGLITTAGFRDVVEIGRAVRKPNIYDINWRPKVPLVPRKNRVTVHERIDACGKIVEPLDEDSVVKAFDTLLADGVTSVAVCLLHAYANPVHEERIQAIAQQQYPQLAISISSAIVRQFREYERTSTTCINAYVAEPLRKHLDRLNQALSERDIQARPYIMRGNGGVISFTQAKKLPVSITHSGPVGGIIGGIAVARAAGFSDIITFDMGGTSSDVSLVSSGKPTITSRGTLADYPVQLPTIDLITIGAGGGSKACIDEGGALHVGPESAGSVPGPLCYGQDGSAPTITDANLFTGRLNESYFLAGKRSLYPDLSQAGIRTCIGEPLSLAVEEAALGIIDIAEANMINAIKLVSVQRGLDPRDFTLVGFGGAGPLHVVSLAEELGMETVLIPPAPGNVSASGLLCAEWRQDLVQTFINDLDSISLKELSEKFNGMMADTLDAIACEQDFSEPPVFALFLDLQYEGQGYELSIPVSQQDFDNGNNADLIKRFSQLHAERYGYMLAERAVQIVNLRLTALGSQPPLPWPKREQRASGSLTSIGERKVLHRKTNGLSAWPVFRFVDVIPGDSVAGPAIVEYPGSTLVLPPAWVAVYDDWCNAVVKRSHV